MKHSDHPHDLLDRLASLEAALILKSEIDGAIENLTAALIWLCLPHKDPEPSSVWRKHTEGIPRDIYEARWCLWLAGFAKERPPE